MARSTKDESAPPAGLPLLRLLAVTAVALTTANCAQNTQKLAGAPVSTYDAKYGVKASPRLYNEGDTIPKGGGRRFSGKPYVVAGRTYVPRDDAKGYVREGLASWYGSAFHGRMTANGEVFDRHSIAAAHPTLPLPSYARVTNLSNGHSMIVRVNDRGPYHANRVMDVSEEVAGALDFHRSGTARVRVEYVGKASTSGSDDRKLMATLRTDGEPAAVGGRSPVMMADLGPEAAPERLERPERPALAFKPAVEEADEAAPAPRPVRPAPVLVAGGSAVAVPAALQPTARSAHAFRPTLPSRSAPPTQMAAMAPRAAAPLRLSPPPLRLAGAGFAAAPPSKRGPAPASETRTAQAKGPAAPQRVAAASLPVRMGAGPAIGRAGPVRPVVAAAPVRMAAVTPPARPATGQAVPAGTRSVSTPIPAATLATARLGTAKLGVPPAGPQTGRGKLPAPTLVASGAKPATAARRAQVAEVR